jgi:hypothetical protein
MYTSPSAAEVGPLAQLAGRPGLSEASKSSESDSPMRVVRGVWFVNEFVGSATIRRCGASGKNRQRQRKKQIPCEKAPIQVTLSQSGLKPHSAFQRTSVSDCAIESALATQVVFHKLAIRKRTLDEQAVGEAGSAENTIGELAFDERADIEQPPVPIDVFEGAVVEIGIDRNDLRRQVFKIAEFEVVIGKVDRGKVTGAYRFSQHHFSLCIEAVSPLHPFDPLMCPVPEVQAISRTTATTNADSLRE